MIRAALSTSLRVLLVGSLAGAFLLSSLSIPGLARAGEGGDLEDLLGGFDDSEEAEGGDDDILSGFDDDDLGAGEEPGSDQEPEAPRWWTLSGDVGLGVSYNYLEHRSGSDEFEQLGAQVFDQLLGELNRGFSELELPPWLVLPPGFELPPELTEPPPGLLESVFPTPVRTQWGDLSRLRLDLYLQLDLDLPADWKARLSGWGFYDFAYRIHDDREYTDEVLDLYEWELDFREVWIQGSLLDNFDLKLGRQIVNWGRSDSIRVLDVFNPLDNREPGLVDIEDLKRPVTMLRLDYYLRGRLENWNLQLLVVPEIRYNQDPRYGSDFNPLPFPVERDRPRHWGETPEFGLAVNGIFHGWDVSFYGAYYYEDQPWLSFDMGVAGALEAQVVSIFPFEVSSSISLAMSMEAVERQSRILMGGVGGNYTVGSWLFKGELAFLQGFEFGRYAGYQTAEVNLNLAELRLDSSFSWGLRRDGMFGDKSRWDVMLGVEYYGFSDTQIAVEVAYRHLNGFKKGRGDILDPDYVSGMDNFPNYAQEHEMTTALRVTQDLLNDRLHLTALGIMFGTDSHDGSIVRLAAEYELRDALLVTGGLVLYQDGDAIQFRQINRNDRIFLEVEYSF